MAQVFLVPVLRALNAPETLSNWKVSRLEMSSLLILFNKKVLICLLRVH
jgi:hypothetical protein